jgi:hypothetical protein
MTAGGAMKARVPKKPIPPAATNPLPTTPNQEVDPTEDRSMINENAGYMLAGA